MATKTPSSSAAELLLPQSEHLHSQGDRRAGSGMELLEDQLPARLQQLRPKLAVIPAPQWRAAQCEAWAVLLKQALPQLGTQRGSLQPGARVAGT